MDNKTTFVIADNQDITRMGMRAYITAFAEEVHILEAATKKELMRILAEHPDGIVILDYTLFDLQSVDELLIIARRFPDARWILFSSELGEQLIRRLSVESAVSMILKENVGEEIRTALACAVRHERFLCHQITNLLLIRVEQPQPQSLLTATEIEVLKLIARGKSVKEIAAERVSSIHTIITHKKNIFRKLDVNNVYEATKYALRAGLVDMVEYYI